MTDKRIDMFDGLEKTKQIVSWKCDGCKKVSEDDRDFIFVYGDICRGRSGGLIGHNFDDNMQLSRINVYCPGCFAKIINDAFGVAKSNVQIL